MRIEVFEHAVYEGIGTLADWAKEKEHQLNFTRWELGERPPESSPWDLLVIMGGPMNIHEETEYPWMVAEKAALDRELALNRPVLGICLGAQLLADRLGGAVGRNAWSEIGWHPIELTEAGTRDPIFSVLPRRMEVFHWHGDTLAIPPGATHGAFSEACAAQAFRKGRSVGLQFHLEFSPDALGGLIQATERFEGRYVQNPQQFLSRADDFARLRQINFALLDRIQAELVEGRTGSKG